MDGIFPDHESVLRDILTSLGKPVDESVIKQVHEKRVAAKLIPFKEINSEIIRMLQALKELDMKIGLISNCTPEEVIGWKDSGLQEFFDNVIFSYEVRHAKPNKEIYLLACKNLNLSPEQSIFIGDGGSDELVGAKNAGIKAYHATWFLPANISEKITDFPKLQKPLEVVDIINTRRLT